MTSRKRVAALVTEYRIRAHADNIVTRLLEGYELHWEIVTPRVDVASLYMDQVPDNDIGRELAATHGVPIAPSIREALTLGGDSLAVDGVVIVAEHGDYPLNEKGQKLYPRRRIFEEAAAVMRESGRAVPVFSDKHLAYNWADARWIYDTAKELGIPFMAGSSMPFAFRMPPLNVPYGAEVKEIVVVAQGGIESYGFHALEIAQSLAERRKGHETGVTSVQCLTGAAFHEELARGHRWSRDLEDAAIAVQPHRDTESAREYYAQDGDSGSPGRRRLDAGQSAEPAVFLVEYKDGLSVTVLMLNGYVRQWSAAVRVDGQSEPLATWFLQSRMQPVWNFCHQVDHIERLMENGRPSFPIERTLLTTGLIDAVMTSRHEQGRRLETPHLAITYAPSAPPPHHERSVHPAYPVR